MGSAIFLDDRLVCNSSAAEHEPRPTGLKRIHVVYKIGSYRRLRYESDESDDLVEAQSHEDADFDELRLTPQDAPALEGIIAEFDAVSDSGGFFVSILAALLQEMHGQPDRAEFLFRTDFDA